MRQKLNTISDTIKFAEELNDSLILPTTIFLSGDLGAGKTTFCKYLAEANGIPSEEIKSPTYSYIRQYFGENITINHIDLYRVDYIDEELEMEILEQSSYPDNITLIEWPERLGEFTDIKADIKLEFHFDGKQRTVLKRSN